MSLLTLLQSASVRLGLPKPQAIVSSTDTQVMQLLEIANEEGKELYQDYGWQALTREATFNTVALESQGSILTVAGTDFGWIINDTIWNRDLRRPVFGPLDSQNWQALKAMTMQGPFNQYRIRGNNIIFIPVPAAGQACYFEWVSKNWVSKSDGSAFYPAWNADTDVGVLSEDLMALGVIWRWRQIKGYEYAEDFAKYERMKANVQAKDGGKPKLTLGGNGYIGYEPIVMVPAGSWNV